MIKITPEEYNQLYGTQLPEAPKENNFLNRTQEAFGQGVSKIGSAYQESKTGVNPISTGLKYASGAIETAFSPVSAALQPVVEPTIGAGIKYASDKISDNKSVQKFATSKAGQTTARVAEDVGNAATIAGTVAPFAGARVPKIPTGKINAAVGTVTDRAQRAVSAQPAKIMQRVARISKGKQAKFENMAKQSVGEYLTKRNIYGDVDKVVAQLYDRFTTSKAVADEAFKTLPGRYAPKPVVTMLRNSSNASGK